MAQAPSIDRLLNLVPDSPEVVLQHLQSHPQLASQQDAHGYSLVHAAASYGHATLLKALIRTYNVDANLKDEDGETALFVGFLCFTRVTFRSLILTNKQNVEEVQMAKELIDLGTDMNLPNNDGQTAAQKLDDEDEQPAVATYLKQLSSASGVTGAAAATEHASPADQVYQNRDTNEVHPPPPLPDGMQLNVGTMAEAEAGEEPDPEFRRRIEELAARPDFQTEEGQRQLRSLVTDALSGLSNESQVPPASRRRLD